MSIQRGKGRIIMKRDNEEFKKWITEEIKRFVREDPDNRFKLLDGSYIWEEPLVGFVAGNDPLFYQLKEVIGKFHLTPYEAMSKIAEKKGMSAPSEEELGVVSYILPISKKTREENANMKEMPSETREKCMEMLTICLKNLQKTEKTTEH